MLRTVLKIKIRNRARKTALGAANTDGTAAVEFALLLPVMITLFFGVVESSMALICRSGNRSASAAGLLMAAGGDRPVYNVAGGIGAWSAVGGTLMPCPNC